MALSGLRRLFRLVVRPPPVEQEIDAEIAFHLDAEVEALVARGMDRGAARAEARRRFGRVDQTRAELARIDRGRRMKERRVSRLEDLGQDLGYAFRGFRRQPAFAGLIVLILGLGIGANATMFGLVDRLLLRPPARVVDADRVVRFQLSESEPGMGSWTNESVAWRTFTDQRDHAGYYSSIAAYFTHSGMPLGRLYRDEEDRPGAGSPVAVLSWRYWQRSYGGDRGALGRRLFLGSRSYTVIGVAPEGFNGVDLNAVDLWVPFHAGAVDVVGDGKWRDTYNWQWLDVLARLKPGVTRAA